MKEKNKKSIMLILGYVFLILSFVIAIKNLYADGKPSPWYGWYLLDVSLIYIAYHHITGYKIFSLFGKSLSVLYMVLLIVYIFLRVDDFLYMLNK